MFGDSSIRVKCKRCNRQAPADLFAMDPVYGMIVCPDCVRERKNGETKPPISPEKQKQDAEDAYLERAYQLKLSKMVPVEKAGEDKVKYQCPKCKYKFIYNTATRAPARCPYCSGPIQKFRMA
ncbi:hypothetical protein HZB02_00420 [Candidatus Woesearchaeota archaeon]|nr:hypothetical protein [Candidatus Woesearchaeota archaeon]